ncbi:MAG: dTDP-4-dehydrorhamnose reductase [Desulfobulbaceae bacterium]
MNILVTGARGQLGRDCIRVLSGAHAVTGFDSRELDITDPEQVKDCFAALRPEVVINCAACTAVDRCETEQERCLRVNGEGPGVLAAACDRISARLIHISTDYVFDGSKKVPEPYCEDDAPGPLSVYGMSKLTGEERIRERLENHLILRSSWLYGMGGANFLKTMLRLALADPDRTIRVVNDQFGALTWTFRLARQIETLLSVELTGIVHAGAEGYGTWCEGAGLFLKAMRVPFSLEPCTTAEYPTPARRPANSILENAVLKNKGLNRMVAWEEDVKTFAERHRQDLLTEAAASLQACS